MGICNTKNKIIPQKFVLGIIDPQNDFFKNGILPIKNAEKIISPINRLRFLCQRHIDTFITQNYLLENTMFMYSNQLLKNTTDIIYFEDSIFKINHHFVKEHCIVNTDGYLIHNDIIRLKNDKIFTKRLYAHNAFHNTELNNWLKNNNINNIILVGIGLDYCIYNTIIEASKLGYTVHLILSCLKGFCENTVLKVIEILCTYPNVVIYQNVDHFYLLNSHIFY